jgi:hypothetical protein
MREDRWNAVTQVLDMAENHVRRGGSGRSDDVPRVPDALRRGRAATTATRSTGTRSF